MHKPYFNIMINNYIEWLEYPSEEKLILIEDPITNKVRALEDIDRIKILKGFGINYKSTK